jgi:hypothetical protein
MLMRKESTNNNKLSCPEIPRTSSDNLLFATKTIMYASFPTLLQIRYQPVMKCRRI